MNYCKKCSTYYTDGTVHDCSKRVGGGDKNVATR